MQWNRHVQYNRHICAGVYVSSMKCMYTSGSGHVVDCIEII